MKDISVITEESKIRWAGGITDLADILQTSHITEWYPQEKNDYAEYVEEIAGRN